MVSAPVLITGAVAGLVAITPASGYVQPMPALVIGGAAGVVCYLACSSLKGAFGYDDVLELARAARESDPFGYRGEFLQLVNLAASL